jgi:hypothetical protein
MSLVIKHMQFMKSGDLQFIRSSKQKAKGLSGVAEGTSNRKA